MNCIRQGGDGAGKQPSDLSLVTEQGKRLELQPCSMSLISLDSRIMLDDLEGLTLKGGTGIQIGAAGRVAIKGKDVTLEMKGGGEDIPLPRVRRPVVVREGVL